jgi:hypothetical protein
VLFAAQTERDSMGIDARREGERYTTCIGWRFWRLRLAWLTREGIASPARWMVEQDRGQQSGASSWRLRQYLFVHKSRRGLDGCLVFAFRIDQS